MLILVIGIVVFLGVHSLAAFRGVRAGLIESHGATLYKAAFALGSLFGFVLIVWGFSRYRAEGLIPLWTPPLWTRHIAMTLMWFAFVALAAMNPAPGRIRGWLRHPMLAAIKIWALAHLIANGDAGGVLLFGAFLAWAVFDRIAVKRRGDLGAPRVEAFTRADATVVVAGTIAYVAMLFLHPLLIGVSILG